MRNRRVRVYSWRDKLTAVVVAAWFSVFAPASMAQSIIVAGGGGGAATSVSAAAFPLLGPAGTEAAPTYSYSTDSNTGWYQTGSGGIALSTDGTTRLAVVNVGGVHNFVAAPGTAIGMASANPNANVLDTGFARAAAGVSKFIGAGNADAWVQNTAGDQFLTGNHTNATATPTDLTDLTVTVVSGRKYSFDLVLIVSQSVAADGARVDFEGGTAAATNFVADVTILDGAAYDTHTVVSALATDVTSTDIGTTVKIEAKGSFEPSGNGTFIPRIGLEAASTGTITTLRGSYFWVKDMP